MEAWAITSFRDDYRFLSNFYPSKLTFGDIEFPTVEHAYQAAKASDKRVWPLVAALETPGEAKKAGQKIPLRDGWEESKYSIMKHLVTKKFEDKWLRSIGSSVKLRGRSLPCIGRVAK